MLDSSRYYNPIEVTSILIMKFCEYEECDYVNLSEALIDAENSGNQIRWSGDPYFNNEGHSFFAELIFKKI